MTTRTELTVNLMKTLVAELEGLTRANPVHEEAALINDADEWVASQDREQETGEDILIQLFDANMLRIRSQP